MVGQLSRSISKNPEVASTPRDVSKIKEIHARVTKFCSGNEMRTSGRGSDGRTSEATPILPAPTTSGGGYKIDMVVMGVIFSHYFLILIDRAEGSCHQLMAIFYFTFLALKERRHNQCSGQLRYLFVIVD